MYDRRGAFRSTGGHGLMPLPAPCWLAVFFIFVGLLGLGDEKKGGETLREDDDGEKERHRHAASFSCRE